MMKLTIGIAAVTALVATPLFAADMAVKAPPPAPVMSSWTGFYIGGNGGYGWNDTNVTGTPADPNTTAVFLGQSNVAPASTSLNTTGWFGGVQAGYNWQFNETWVAGVETDFDGANIGGSGSGASAIAFGATPATFNANDKVKWFGTLRARLGFLPTNSLLLYATGGLAYGKVDESANVGLAPGLSNSTGNFGFTYACGGIYGSPTCFAGSNSQTSAGWTAGGGAEYQFTRNLSLKFEYLYVNLGGSTFAIRAVNFAGGSTPSFLNVRFGDTAFNSVRGGVNYRF
ncbi:MAG: outer membrane protein [Bradyrhizobium sp.]